MPKTITKMRFVSLFFILLVHVLISVMVIASGGKNFYEILGIPRNADENAIKKAYRKLAKKYHPDRHQDAKKKEKAEKLFIQVAKAYETLMDPEKRRIYDQVGEEGLNNAQQQGGGGGGGGFQFHHGGGAFDAFKIFEQMFGSRGFGGFGGEPQRQRQQQGRGGGGGFSFNSVLDLTSTQKAKEVIGKEQRAKDGRVVLVMFYAPWCGHCQNAKPHFDSFAAEAKGIIRAGAVNCEENKQLCSVYKVQGFPTIIALVPDEKPVPYEGERSAKAMFNFATGLIPIRGNLKNVKSEEEAKAKCVGMDVCVLLQSNKKTPSSLYKALAFRFRNQKNHVFLFFSTAKGTGELLINQKKYGGEIRMDALYNAISNANKTTRKRKDEI